MIGCAWYDNSHLIISLTKNNNNPVVDISNIYHSVNKKLEKIIQNKITFFKVNINNKKISII